MIRHRMLLASVILVCSGSAFAWNDPPAADDGVLGGPKVREIAPPGNAGTFGAGKQARYQERPTPQNVFMKAFEVLRAETTAAELRLSDEQAAALKTVEADFRKEQVAFVQKNKAELERLGKVFGVEPPEQMNERTGRRWFEQVRAAVTKDIERVRKNEAAKKDDAMRDDGMMNQDAAEANARTRAREEIKVLFDASPKIETTQGKMWAVLSDAQRPLVEAEVKRLRAEMEKRGNPAALGLKPSEKNADALPFEIPEQMRERLANLPPEQRERITQRLKEMPEGMRERLKNMPADERRQALARYLREGQGGGNEKNRENGGEKRRRANPQPPSMDDVNVPPPAAEPK
jgi:hypothetical protein